MRSSLISLTAIFFLALAVCNSAIGEVFVLTNGGRVVGELVNVDENPRTKFVVKTSSGGQITIEKDRVKQILRSRPEMIEYERIRPGYPDTVEGQMALAQWCLENNLLSEREKHLRRVIEHEPDHAEARRALKYSKYDGKWMTYEEYQTSQGYVKYKNGKWMTRQQIEILENKRSNELAEKAWFQKIRRWRDWLGTSRNDQGRDSILEIDDPYAVKALAAGLTEDASPQVRILYIEALSKIATPDSLQALAVCSIEDPVEEVRLTCLDYLQEKKTPEVVQYYAGQLKSKDNRVVVKAGLCLGKLNDSTAILPLIDALVTTHKYKIVKGQPGSMTTTFGTGGTGGGGLSMGGGPKIIAQQHRNQTVLDALVRITGRNYQYDENAWKNWYASQKNTQSFDARRD